MVFFNAAATSTLVIFYEFFPDRNEIRSNKIILHRCHMSINLKLPTIGASHFVSHLAAMVLLMAGTIPAYLIFVIFFTRAKFLENKIYTEKRQIFALNL